MCKLASRKKTRGEPKVDAVLGADIGMFVSSEVGADSKVDGRAVGVREEGTEVA